MTPETAHTSPQAQREAPGHGSGPGPQASHWQRSEKRAVSDAWGMLMGEADRLVEEQLEREARLPEPYFAEGGIVIYCGDNRHILPHIPSQSVDVLWTDPPYGHGNHDGDLNARLNDHRQLKNCPIENDGADEMRVVVDAMLIEAARILKQDCCCCCCCCGGGPRPTFAWLAERMDRAGLDFFHSVIWDKANPGLGWRYRRQHEMIMVAHRTGGKLRWADDGLAVPNIVRMMPDRVRIHPNEKPVALTRLFLKLHSIDGDTILDPFMGSGTTLVAAKQLGRRAIGIEIEEKYCEIAVNRLRQSVFQFDEPAPEPEQLGLLDA